MQSQFTFASELPAIVPSDAQLAQSMHYFGAPFAMVPIARKITPLSMPAQKSDDRKSKVSHRRAEQNRQAQKSFRERKVKYVQDLEDRLQEATKSSMEADLLRIENTELRSLVSSLQNENSKLKHKMRSEFNFTPEINEDLLPKFEDLSKKNEVLANNKDCENNDINTNSNESSVSNDNKTDIAKFTSEETPSFSTPISNVETPISSNNATSPPSNMTSPASEDEVSPEAQIINEILGFEHDVSSPSFLVSDTIPNSEEDWSFFVDTNKRDLDEANLYLSNITKPAVILAKNEAFLKDHEQEELCDMFKKVQCKDKNPELCQGTKYMKSSD